MKQSNLFGVPPFGKPPLADDQAKSDKSSKNVGFLWEALWFPFMEPRNWGSRVQNGKAPGRCHRRWAEPPRSPACLRPPCGVGTRTVKGRFLGPQGTEWWFNGYWDSNGMVMGNSDLDSLDWLSEDLFLETSRFDGERHGFWSQFSLEPVRWNIVKHQIPPRTNSKWIDLAQSQSFK